MRSIEITFHDGTVKLEGHGFKGKECDKILAPFEKALTGDNVTERTNKPEYIQATTSTTIKQTV